MFSHERVQGVNSDTVDAGNLAPMKAKVLQPVLTKKAVTNDDKKQYFQLISILYFDIELAKQTTKKPWSELSGPGHSSPLKMHAESSIRMAVPMAVLCRSTKLLPRRPSVLRWRFCFLPCFA